MTIQERQAIGEATANRVSEQRARLRYHRCQDCDVCFKSTSLVDGKLPRHTFNGKQCDGQEAA